MTYHFRALPELYWSILTAAATVLLIELVSLDPEGVSDWRKWAVALGAGVVRAAAGAALDWLRREMAEPDPDPLVAIQDELLALTPAERDRLTRYLEMHARIADRTGRTP